MQVILMEKVVNLGALGDVVKVKDGYARNFLIPHGKAKRATEANLKEFEGRRGELEKKAADLLSAAQERAAKLEGLMVQITRKAGVDGRLFGSVTNADISEALEAQGIKVAKARDPHAPGPAQARGRVPDHRAAALRRARQLHRRGAGRAVTPSGSSPAGRLRAARSFSGPTVSLGRRVGGEGRLSPFPLGEASGVSVHNSVHTLSTGLSVER